MSLTMERNLLNVYDFINNFRNNMGYPPSIREIMTALNIKSTSSVHSYLKKLDEKGYIHITTKNKSRAIELPGAILKDKTVFAFPAINCELKNLPGKDLTGYSMLSARLQNHTKDLFVVKMPDNTLSELLIQKNDYLILKKSHKATKRDLYLYKDSSGYFLTKCVHNKQYTAYVEPDTELCKQSGGVIGTLVCLIRSHLPE